MKTNVIKILSVISVLLVGCASDPKKINLIHVHEANTFEDQKSVFYSNDNLFDKDISVLLKSKIKIPQKVKIAIIKLQPRQNDGNYREFRTNRDPLVQEKNDTSPFLKNLLNYSDITSVLVPESLVPAKADLRWIRNLGATMRADLVLVVDSRNDKFTDLQIIKKGLAMSVSSADAYLIDTLTGVILSANTYTKDAITKKTDADFDAYYTLDRARVASEKKIYKKLADDVIDTLSELSKTSQF